MPIVRRRTSLQRGVSTKARLRADIRRRAKGPKQKNRNSRNATIVSEMKSTVSKKIELPKSAEELWPGRCHSTESLVKFFTRVWGKYIPFGLSMSYLCEVDEKLYHAIHNYHATTGKRWPKKLRVKTREGNLQEKFNRMQKEGVEALTPEELYAVARKMLREKKQSSKPARP